MFKTASKSNVFLPRLPLVWLIICVALGGWVMSMGVAPARTPTHKLITKAIEDVQVGDYVLAKDPNDPSPPVAHRVVALPRNWTAHIVHMEVNGAGDLQATRNHPFWVVGKGWQEARDLGVGDELITDTGAMVRLTALRVEDRREDVYNLTVDGVHTYFVVAGAVPVLVHNANTTSLGVTRDSKVAWQSLRDTWDQNGYGSILSKNNRWRIDNGFSPRVDEAWRSGFPGAGANGQILEMHHVGGGPVQIPLTRSQHFEAHGKNWQGPGGPGCGG